MIPPPSRPRDFPDNWRKGVWFVAGIRETNQYGLRVVRFECVGTDMWWERAMEPAGDGVRADEWRSAEPI